MSMVVRLALFSEGDIGASFAVTKYSF